MPALFLSLLLAVHIAPSGTGAYSQPQLASDGQTTAVVFGSGNTIYYSRLNSSPVRVADVPNLALGNHRGPRLAFTRSAIIVTADAGPTGQQYGPGTLRSWRSTDHGATWTPGPDLSTPGAGGMGFQAIASDGSDRLWAAWIGPHDGHPTLFITHSEDGGRTFAPQRVLSPTVCECCHPTVTVSPSGAVHVLFRNSLDGNRDFYLAESSDGQTFHAAKLGQGSWAINACPMDGGGMAEFQGKIVTLWRRQSQIFLARPGGGAEEPFAAGKNPAVALREKGVYAVWSTAEGIMAKAPGKDPWLLSKSGAYPVLSPTGPVMAAWEDAGAIHVESIE